MSYTTTALLVALGLVIGALLTVFGFPYIVAWIWRGE